MACRDDSTMPNEVAEVLPEKCPRYQTSLSEAQPGRTPALARRSGTSLRSSVGFLWWRSAGARSVPSEIGRATPTLPPLLRAPRFKFSQDPPITPSENTGAPFGSGVSLSPGWSSGLWWTGSASLRAARLDASGSRSGRFLEPRGEARFTRLCGHPVATCASRRPTWSPLSPTAPVWRGARSGTRGGYPQWRRIRGGDGDEHALMVMKAARSPRVRGWRAGEPGGLPRREPHGV